MILCMACALMPCASQPTLAQKTRKSIPICDAKTLNKMIFKNAPTTTDSVLVVNFWATWCAPCVAELPEFVHLDSVIKAQKLPARILMVSFDFKRDLQSKLIPFVSERIPALGCVLFSDSDTDAFIGSVDKEWSGSLPATLIIKQSGTCRTFMERQVSREELEQLVKSCIH